MTTYAQPVAQSDQFLRRTLQVDAAVSTSSVVAALLAAGPLAALTGIPAGLIQGIGLAFILFVALVLYGMTRPVIDRRVVWLVMSLNFAWVALSVAALIFGWLPLTTFGFWLVAAQALVVDLLAVAQFIGLRRGR